MAGRVTTIVLLISVVALASGCADKEKQQIQSLYNEKQQLAANNQSLQDQLAAAQQQNAALKGQLQSASGQLAGRDSAIERMRPTATSPAAAPPAAPGWEAGKFVDKVSVGTDILFLPGRAELTPQGKTKLDKIAADLKKTYAGLPVRVYGYTDADPIKKSHELWQDNLDLSANRAMAVTRYLWERGIDAERVETIAMGQTKSVAANTSAAGKAKNRRVEIIVVKSGSKGV